MLGEIRRTLKSEGLAVHPVKTRAFYLKGYGFSPDVVFDVGVHDGTPWLYKSFPNARFVLVDPQPDCADAVRTSGQLDDFDFHAVALGAETGIAALNVPETTPGKGGAMASLMERTDNLATTFNKVDTYEVPVKRLDDVAKAYDGRVGLKIDTEGFEAAVLAGGPKTLKRCEFVILELSVTDRFTKTAPPSEAIALLAQAGLELRDILAIADGPGKRAQPRHMDVMFTRWAA
ncbi:MULTISPECIES: FkbM family methyltransferase [Roseobacteraceae]|jgi:FkbM family methyltransferase|uniref:Methyltransferase FkbM domain protein n=1 Tax=Pseudosulfitobacter pseudonitzschiae TaxID=1402135 RepID=A0A221JWZ5_9RHOB|nr:MULTISPECIES: FkbM family methyltransferase [Roseobacteraceae]ASM71236.1 methyltransferase FkbM domain protein [Pseudosulfitobacter pseudonitzschiae]